MRKLILVSLILFCSMSYGQKLILTPNGLRDSINTEKTYVVITIEGKTAKQLYDNAIKYINKAYKNPEDVIKGKTDGEYLKFITHEPQIFSFKFLGKIMPSSANFTTELSFKDGKVKYEILNLEIQDKTEYGIETTPLIRTTGGGFFNKDGTSTTKFMAKAKIDVQNYFNTQISNLYDALIEKSKNDSW